MVERADPDRGHAALAVKSMASAADSLSTAVRAAGLPHPGLVGRLQAIGDAFEDGERDHRLATRDDERDRALLAEAVRRQVARQLGKTLRPAALSCGDCCTECAPAVFGRR